MRKPNRWMLMVGVIGITAVFGLWKLVGHSSFSILKDGQDIAFTGSEVSYVFDIETRMQRPGQPESMLLAFVGELKQRQQGPQEFVSEWQDIKTFSTSGQQMPGAVVESLLRQPIVSKLAGGKFEHYISEGFPGDLRTMQLNFMQKLFLAVDVKSTRQLTHNERDETGLYTVRYTFAPKGMDYRVTRTWMQSLNQTIKIDADRNSLQYLFTSSGRLLKLEGEVVFHVTSPEPITYRTRVDVSLKGSQASVATLPRIDVKDLQRLETHTPGAQEIGGEGGLSFEAALQMLDAFKDNASSQEDLQLYNALAEGLRANPSRLNDLIEKITGNIRRDEDSKRQISMLFSVLAGSGTSEGSEALAELAITKCPDEFCKDQAMMAYNFHSRPSANSASAMLQLAEDNNDPDLSGTAFLAVGAAGSKLPSDFPELSKALIDSLSNPTKAEIKTTLIAAMGNHADSVYLPVLKESVESEDYKIRAAAAYSLRHITSDKVNDILLDTLERETDLYVTKEALKAIQARNLSSEDYLRVARKGASAVEEDIHTDTARVLISAYRQNPSSLENAVKAMKDQTPFQDVRTFMDEELKRADQDRALIIP